MPGLAFTKKKKKFLEPQRKQKRKALRGSRTHRFFRYAHARLSTCVLYSLQAGFVTSKAIEAARRTIRRFLRRKHRIGVRIFAAKSFTKKPSEVRMGGGKGKPAGFVRPVWPGSALFQLRGTSVKFSKYVLSAASKKFFLKTSVVGFKKKKKKKYFASLPLQWSLLYNISYAVWFFCPRSGQLWCSTL